MNSKHCFLYLFTFMSLLACDKENAPDCFQKGGEIELQTRSISAFPMAIECNDFVDIELFHSSSPQLEVSGPKNLLPEVISDLEDGTLRIENKNTCNIVRSYDPRLVVRLGVDSTLARLEVNGQGDVRSLDTLKLHQFEIVAQESIGDFDFKLITDDLKCINHAGVSNFKIAGEGRKAEFFHQGFGLMNAANFTASEVYSNNNSIGALKVFSASYLFAFIGSKGNIYYRGNPPLIDASVTGSGTLIALD